MARGEGQKTDERASRLGYLGVSGSRSNFRAIYFFSSANLFLLNRREPDRPSRGYGKKIARVVVGCGLFLRRSGLSGKSEVVALIGTPCRSECPPRIFDLSDIDTVQISYGS